MRGLSAAGSGMLTFMALADGSKCAATQVVEDGWIKLGQGAGQPSSMAPAAQYAGQGCSPPSLVQQTR